MLQVKLKMQKKNSDAELMKNYSVLKRRQHVPISPKKLENHFKNHFKDRPLETSDEVINPQRYQHLSPSEELGNIRVDEAPPDGSEVKNIIRFQIT